MKIPNEKVKENWPKLALNLRFIVIFWSEFTPLLLSDKFCFNFEYARMLRFLLFLLIGTLFIFGMALITAVLSNMLARTKAWLRTFGRTHAVGYCLPSSFVSTFCICN